MTRPQLVETIGEKGAEAAWDKAQAIWKKVMAHFQDDAKLQAAAQAVGLDPADEDFLNKFAKPWQIA
jgi:hypothetical protein